ncbi:hypothetical protein [Clostridium sp.]|jgi:hypothetical protein|uniref:hypothetical protein n=1 Tax=Clostridium sp. TaxID=1506 RepID=UPI003A2C9CC7
MKKVIGIISIVLFVIVTFQSCAAGVANSLSSNKEVSGSAGLFLAFAMLIAGIISLISKYSKGLTITAIVFYVLAFIIGIANVGTVYKDLQIWSILNLIFGLLLLFHILKNKQLYNGNTGNKGNTTE